MTDHRGDGRGWQAAWLAGMTIEKEGGRVVDLDPELGRHGGVDEENVETIIEGT